MTKDGDPVVFELTRLSDYSNNSIIAEMKRVAGLVPDGALTVSLFTRLSRVDKSVVYRRFGNWKNALQAADLLHRSSECAKTKGTNPSRNMTGAEVLDALRALSTKLGKTTITVAEVEEHLNFSRATLIRRWGSSKAALEAAGLEVSNLGRRYTDEECYNNLLTVWSYHRRPPTHSEMGLPPSQVGGKAYTKRFKTWNKALAAFADRANQDNEPALQSANRSVAQKPFMPAAPIIDRSTDERRDIPLGLRFRVLHRDCFKCVLCGDHPAQNARCILHVDHIIPWSQGGATRADNLRSLCAPCNIGRGNRFSD